MKKRNKTLVCLMAACLLSLALFSWFKPADTFSDSERRGLKQFPKLTVETLIDGTFARNFESYALDQFPLRDTFRSIKSLTVGYVFQQQDVNGLYTYDGHIASVEYPMNPDSLKWAAGRFQNIYEMYLKGTETRLYFSIIPDKGYFLAEESGHLAMDYGAFVADMTKQVPYLDYIDIMNQLTADDYYLTDSHWKQTNLLGVVQMLAERMNVPLNTAYDTVDLEEPFYGVYYGQLARPMKADTLSYLTNDQLEQCKVFDWQNNKDLPMYDSKKATGKDPYEMFLGGPLSLVTIENPHAATDRELVMFRDSFGSSIAPLFAESYRKITLVDIRYIQPAILKNYIEFDQQDVLFLYSTSVLNNSSTIM